MTAPAIVGSIGKNQFTTTTASPLTVTLGQTATAGNLLVAVLVTGTNAVTHTTPSGWTVATGTGGSIQNIAVSNTRMSVYWKKAAGSETSVALSWSSGTPIAVGAAFEISGANTSSPFDITAGLTGYTPINSTASTASGTSLTQLSSNSTTAFSGGPDELTLIFLETSNTTGSTPSWYDAFNNSPVSGTTIYSATAPVAYYWTINRSSAFSGYAGSNLLGSLSGWTTTRSAIAFYLNIRPSAVAGLMPLLNEAH